MSWYKREERDATIEEIDASLARHEWKDLRAFRELLLPTDKIKHVIEGDNNRGCSYYYVRRDSLKISIVVSSFMS